VWAYGVVQVVILVTFTVCWEPDPDRCPDDKNGPSFWGMVEVGCKLALPGHRSGTDILDVILVPNSQSNISPTVLSFLLDKMFTTSSGGISWLSSQTTLLSVSILRLTP
jgi:hypothetical protein